MVKMEKYCIKCRKAFDDMNYNNCPICTTELIEREIRPPIPPKLRHKIFVRDGYRCRECGKNNKETSLEIDHIFPLSKGGQTVEDNLQVLCTECNRAKKDDEWKDSEIEITRIDLDNLEKRLHEAEENLKVATTEEEIYALKAKIKKLKKDKIPRIEIKLKELIREEKQINSERKAQKEENKRRENLFNKLYVELEGELLLEVCNYFSLNETSDEDNLRVLIDKYDEQAIYSGISYIKKELDEEAIRKELYNKLDNTLSSDELNLFINEFSFQGSKQDLLNYLIYNYSEDEIDSLKLNLIEKEKRKKKLIKKFNRETIPSEKDILYEEFSNKTTREEIIPFLVNNYSEDEIKEKVIAIRRQEKLKKQAELKEKERQITHLKEILTFNTMNRLGRQFGISQKYYVEDFIKDIEPLNPEKVNEIYNAALKMMQN